MLLWLRNLRIHTFEPRHFENIRVESTSHKNNFKIGVDQGNIEKDEKLSKVNDTINELESNAIENSSKKHNIESVRVKEEPTAKKQKVLE